MKNLYLLCTMFIVSFAFAQDMATATPDSLAESYLAQAESFSENGEFENAIKYCNLALEVAKDKLPVYNKRSSLFFVRQDYARAIEDYTRIIELAPANLGKVYFERGLSKLLMNPYLAADACSDIKKAKALGFTSGGDTYASLCDKM